MYIPNICHHHHLNIGFSHIYYNMINKYTRGLIDISYLLQVKLHKKYDLRHRENTNKENEQNQSKKVIVKDKSKEAYAFIKKSVEPNAKRIEVEQRELKNLRNTFNLEYEPSNIKIHDPIELAKNSLY